MGSEKYSIVSNHMHTFHAYILIYGCWFCLLWTMAMTLAYVVLVEIDDLNMPLFLRRLNSKMKLKMESYFSNKLQYCETNQNRTCIIYEEFELC